MLRRRHLPALVVANLSLPRLDGFALLADLRRLAGPAGPPVVVVSSSKELSGAAWNLKERLGVTELLAADATEYDALETLSRALPSLCIARAGPKPSPDPSSRTSGGSARRSIATPLMSRAASA